MRLFVITNHGVTDEQRSDAAVSLGVSEVVPLPDNLKRLWGSVPPEIPSVAEYVGPVLEWLSKTCTKNDVVWVQGEWGVTIAVLEYCRKNTIRAVYSTTARVAVDRETAAGVETLHIVKHVRFRDFPL